GANPSASASASASVELPMPNLQQELKIAEQEDTTARRKTEEISPAAESLTEQQILRVKSRLRDLAFYLLQNVADGMRARAVLCEILRWPIDCRMMMYGTSRRVKK